MMKWWDFIQQVSTAYRQRRGYYHNNQFLRFNFIAPRDIKEQIRTISKNYGNTDEVLNEVFENGAIKIGGAFYESLSQIFNYNDIKSEFKDDNLVVSLDNLSESRFFSISF